MENKSLILFLLLIVFSCDSLKKITEQKEISNQSFFKTDAVYSEFSENSYVNLYYFNSENKTVYISKIKKNVNDSISKKKKIQLTTSLYGRYVINGNTIKMQKDIDKVLKIKQKHIFSITFMFIPVRPSKATTDVIVVDKEIITEGYIKQDSIIITKNYLGTKKLNYKKKFLSKTNLIKSLLIYKPNLKGVILKDNEFSSYSALIISN